MSHHVAIVMSEVFLRRLTPSLMPFVKRELDYRIISIHRPMAELERLLKDPVPDGLITEWLPEKTEALLDLGIRMPTVIVDTDFLYPGVVSVDIDDWAVGREAAAAFRRAGLESLACLGNGQPYSDQRIEGFFASLDDDMKSSVLHVSGFEDTRYSESFTRPSTKLKRWLRNLPKPVGIFAVHDPLGRFLCRTCESIGLSVPGEVAVIGANNDELVCGLTYPMLSSVSIPWNTLGEVVAQSMQTLLSGGEVDFSRTRLVAPGGVEMRHSANHLAIDDPTVRRAMTWLSEHLLESISVGQLCGELRIARRTLERKFVETYRCTPWEMICLLRVNRAKSLLVETNHPVSLVSELCGFNDPERMAVVFKKVTGTSPSKYRRN